MAEGEKVHSCSSFITLEYGNILYQSLVIAVASILAGILASILGQNICS